MEIKYLSFGNLTLKIELPTKLREAEKYEDFFCEERPSDFVFGFRFAEKTIEPSKNALTFEDGNKLVCLDGENRSVYYKAAVSGTYFAVREKCGEKNYSVTVSKEAKEKFWARLVLNSLGVEELAARKNGFVFHSSFVKTNEKALLFTGPCGIGKSTQAKLWNTFRAAEIINGDKTLIYLEDGKVFASGLPFSGSSKVSFNEKTQLKTIVALEKGSENKARFLERPSAFRVLMKSAYVPFGFGEEISRTLAETAERVSFVFLECTPDEGAVKELERLMKGCESVEL